MFFAGREQRGDVHIAWCMDLQFGLCETDRTGQGYAAFGEYVESCRLMDRSHCAATAALRTSETNNYRPGRRTSIMRTSLLGDDERQLIFRFKQRWFSKRLLRLVHPKICIERILEMEVGASDRNLV